MDDETLISVEVVLAEATNQRLIKLKMVRGSRVIEAIEASGLPLSAHAPSERVGIFGRRCRLSDVLDEGDRVELYRPLRHDPKVIRRRRALQSNNSNSA